MLKVKKISIVMLVIIMIACLFTQVNATTDDPLAIPGLDDMTTNETNETSDATIEEDIEIEEEENEVLQPETNVQGSSYTNSENLPQTGVTEDITVMFFIIVCVISAIYAYRKIKFYNA